MSKKQKVLAFVWDFTVNPLELHGWGDGLHQALKILAQKNDWYVKVIASDQPKDIYQEIRELRPDYVLCWGSLDRPSFAGIREEAGDVPIGLCFAGGSTHHPHTDNFDVVFVENEVYEAAFAKEGVNVKRAFGTNDLIFRPLKMSKHWLGFYPAAFAKWKRHELFADALGHDGLAVGKFIEEEQEQIDVCVDAGVVVLPQMPYFNIPYLYNQSRFAVITANTHGGSQRAVLEAMSCNIPPIVMADSEKCSEYVLDSRFGKVVEPNKEAIQGAIAELIADKGMGVSQDGRKYIEDKYSAEGYADALHLGLTSAK